MIYLVVTKKEFENKYFYVSKFISKLYRFISESKDIIAVSKNSIDFNILKLYENKNIAKNFVDIDSSNVVLNGLSVAFDNTLEFAKKVNNFLTEEFDISDNKQTNEDFDILNKFSKIHYINTEFQTAEEAIKDFESRNNEDNCVIVDIFGNMKNNFEKDNVHVINITKLEEGSDKSVEKGHALDPDINRQIIAEEAVAAGLNEGLLNTASDSYSSGTDTGYLNRNGWDFNEIFRKNALKPKNKNENT